MSITAYSGSVRKKIVAVFSDAVIAKFFKLCMVINSELKLSLSLSVCLSVSLSLCDMNMVMKLRCTVNNFSDKGEH